jgi:hypothetical protein
MFLCALTDEFGPWVLGCRHPNNSNDPNNSNNPIGSCTVATFCTSFPAVMGLVLVTLFAGGAIVPSSTGILMDAVPAQVVIQSAIPTSWFRDST